MQSGDRTANDPKTKLLGIVLGKIQKVAGQQSVDQQKALAEYRRLHNQENEQIGLEPVFSPHEVTKQEVEVRTRAIMDCHASFYGQRHHGHRISGQAYSIGNPASRSWPEVGTR